MRFPLPHTLLILGALATAIGATPARADVTSVVETPDPIRVNIDGASIVTLRYRVVSSNSLNSAVRSVSGRFRSGATTIETGGGLLSAPVPTGSATPTTTQFIERLRISRAVARRLATGAAIVYERAFNDGGSVPFISTITLRASSNGALSFRTLSVRFDDETLYRVVERGSGLTARARAVTSGRGVLDGHWEVSGPARSGSEAFQRIQRFQRFLAGGRTTVFESPRLPTDRPGLYAVRFTPFRATSIEPLGSFPVIRYFVTVGASTPGLALVRPRAGARVDATTRFVWAATAGAVAYRLEFTGPRGASGLAGRRLAGVDLRPQPGGLISTRLQPFTLARLRRERASYWRVIAYGGEGGAIAASAFRRLGLDRDETDLR